MTRILHVIDTGGPGGAETVYLNLCTGLDKSRFVSVCVVSREGWLADQLRAGGMRTLIVPSRGSMNTRYLLNLLRVARRSNADVIVAHLYGSAVYCGIVSALLRKPLVTILHGQSDLNRAGRLDALKKMLVRRSAQIVFVSQKLCDELAPRIGAVPSQCRVISNGVDFSRFQVERDDTLRRELGLDPDDILIGAVGNIREPKGYETLLRAASELRSKSAKYRFVIVGEGGNSLHTRLQKLCEELDLNLIVKFLGLRSDVPRILRNLDIYVLSSNTEGFSLACVEAMASGLPVVATRCGGPEEIIENDVSGILVPVGSASAIAEAVRQVAEAPELAQRLSTAARQRVHDRYTTIAMVREYERLFSAGR